MEAASPLSAHGSLDPIEPGSVAQAGHYAVAVVLNKNARAVNAKNLRRLTQINGEEHVFLSSSVADSQRLASLIIERGYHTVLLGGGDGTFVCCLNDLLFESQRQGRPLPRVGVLRLGTGNAIGYYVGVEAPTERGLRTELARAAQSDSSTGDLPLLRVDGKLAPFAGTGLDSQILDDYAATTRALDRVGIGRVISSGLRYTLAVGLRSVPRFMIRRLPRVEVVNVGGPAYAITPDGRVDPVAMPRGTVLYRGPCTLAGAATVPCYGFGVRIFPFADVRKDKFHVRCTDASAIEALSHLPSVLRGTYQSPSLRDFLCDAVEIHMEHPVPMQIGGDIQREHRDYMRIDLADRPVRLLWPKPPTPPVVD
ncbi:MAG TPA: diacylglycerol kinase family protein [Pseudomonadota bacterium]|nr:diacylglycerol kinase family protein [Pseudomonadota bacterium]